MCVLIVAVADDRTRFSLAVLLLFTWVRSGGQRLEVTVWSVAVHVTSPHVPSDVLECRLTGEHHHHHLEQHS